QREQKRGKGRLKWRRGRRRGISSPVKSELKRCGCSVSSRSLWQNAKDNIQQKLYGITTWRRSTELHGGHYRRPHRLSSMARQRLGCLVLAPDRLHAGLHHRTGCGREDQE